MRMEGKFVEPFLQEKIKATAAKKDHRIIFKKEYWS